MASLFDERILFTADFHHKDFLEENVLHYF